MALKDVAIYQVLRIKDFRNLWLSQVISQIFLNLLQFSLMIRIYELTHSNYAVSVLVFLFVLPNILLGALAGVLVDKWGRKPVMFLCHFLRALAVLLFFVSAETIGWIYLLVFVISIITQFFFPAEASTIHEFVQDRKLLLSANGLFTLTFFSSIIIGNVLAGPILALFGDKVTYFTVSGAFLLASFFTARIPGRLTLHFENVIATIKESSLINDFLIGIDHIYKTPVVQKGILALGASQISISVLATIAPGFADKVLHLPITDVSIYVMAPAAAGMALGALVIGQFFRKANRDSLINAGFIIASLGLIVYAFVDKVTMLLNLPLIVVSFFMLAGLGMANALLDVPVNTMIQENTPERIRSRVYGVVYTVIGTAAFLPIFLSGIFADVIGVRLVVLISGIALFGAGVYTQRRYQNVAGTS